VRPPDAPITPLRQLSPLEIPASSMTCNGVTAWLQKLESQKACCYLWLIGQENVASKKMHIPWQGKHMTTVSAG
jgi:hypothetical protein